MSDQVPGSGPTVPGYEILGPLGRGGFATVYRARQLSVDRLVALKVITAHSVDAAAERRFRAEFRTVGSLSWHPNVVALHDAGVTPDGMPFLAMELESGGSWGDRVRQEGAQPPAVVVRVGLQVTDALAAAHEAGIVHRDVKPDNVLISRRGEAKLTDFGIALITDATRSTTGSFVGTITYSAPELLEGARATASSDVYSTGALLHALASGSAPYPTSTDGSPAALVLRVVTKDPEPLPADVPDALAAVIRRAMAKDPAARQAGAAELHEELVAAGEALGLHGLRGTHVSAPTVALSPSRLAALPPEERPTAEEGSTEDRTIPAPRPDLPTDAVAAPEAEGGDDGELEAAARTRSRRRRIGLGIALAVVVIAVVAAALVLLPGRDDGVDDEAVVAEVVGTVVVGGSPQAVAAGDGSIWVVDTAGSTVSRIDPDRDEVEATVDVAAGPAGLAVGESAVYVVHPQQALVSRIDLQSNRVTSTIDVDEDPVDVAVLGGDLWIAHPSIDQVSRVPLAGDGEVRRIAVEGGPVAVAVGAGGVFVVAEREDELVRIDPAAAEVEGRVAVGRTPQDLAVVEDTVYVVNLAEDTLVAVDAENLEPGPATTVVAPVAVAADAEGAWVATRGLASVVWVPSDGSAPSEAAASVDSGGVALGAGSVWVSDRAGGRVVRIDR